MVVRERFRPFSATALWVLQALGGKMRYEILSFPSLYGTPWHARTFAVAYLFAVVRNIAACGAREIRVIDRNGGRHIIL